MTTDPIAPDSGVRVPQVDPPAPQPGAAATTDATEPIGDAAATVRPASARPDPSTSSTGELLHTLTESIQSLVRGEVASARQEMTEKALAARPAAAMLGGVAAVTEATSG